jgi:hypothetical protein
MAATEVIKQRLQWPWWGPRGPRAPVAPEHDPRLQPRPHLTQCDRPGHVRSQQGWRWAGFFPRLSGCRRPAQSPLVGCRSIESGCGGTSRRRRRSRPTPNADGWRDPSALDSRSSPALLWFVCNSAQSATHITPQTALLTEGASTPIIGREGLLRLVALVKTIQAAQVATREEGSSSCPAPPPMFPPALGRTSPNALEEAASGATQTPVVAAQPAAGASTTDRREGE